MATFVLIHGGGGSSWDWHLVAPRLGEHNHVPVAVDLPSEDESAGWSAYVDSVLRPSATAATSWSWGTRWAASRRRSSARVSP